MTMLKSMLLNSTAWSRVAFAPDGVGGGAGDGAGAGDAGAGAGADKPAATDAASVLFPDDKPAGDKPAGEGDKAGKEGEGDKSGAADWKEYVADPAKTDAENATAKEAHDKTKPAADDKKDDKNDVANQVPADGKYVLSMPDGVRVDQGLLDALSPKFAAKGLTNGDVQELVGEFVKHQQAQGEAFAKSPEGAWSAVAHQYFKDNGTPEKWAENAKADKEIGGVKWDATVANAQKAVNSLGTPALKDFLNKSGGGNHPELIRILAKAGAMIGEDTPATDGAGGNGKPAEAAHILFPNDAPKG